MTTQSAIFSWFGSLLCVFIWHIETVAKLNWLGCWSWAFYFSPYNSGYRIKWKEFGLDLTVIIYTNTYKPRYHQANAVNIQVHVNNTWIYIIIYIS